jgi:hypothetical protein
MRQTVVKLVDDIDGSVARESLRFGLNGTEYEIDLSETNAAKFRQTLAPFVQAARKLGKAGAPQLRLVRSSSTRTAADRERLAAIRAWARAQGMEINDRGRISSHLVRRTRRLSASLLRSRNDRGRHRRSGLDVRPRQHSSARQPDHYPFEGGPCFGSAALSLRWCS